MFKINKKAFVSLGFLCIGSFVALNTASYAGAGVGADIYCVMRDGGNDHESSWIAAYQSIKVQKQGLFKTSPRQAASMIVETVVRNPNKFKDCVAYLGDLYPDGKNQNTYTSKSDNAPQTSSKKDRYSY